MSTAPYSPTGASTSSPGASSSDRATAFSPSVAFVAKTRLPASAPTYAASAALASSISPG